ncbi:hypothetical protein AVEN_197767-1 [Araneus ventricosus]|uniref:Uncharacterized protein n=1 Tax=Araneus ventricosus TaxID=182803 RepID=A0A4Y2PZV1_ARAVE|nr:hypothetical protein AVEN_197767-1 [Araneus ventricosus]
MYLVSSPSRCNVSDSSSAGIFLFISSRTAEYCSVAIISGRLMRANLGYGNTSCTLKRDETELTDSLSMETIRAVRDCYERRRAVDGDGIRTPASALELSQRMSLKYTGRLRARSG